MELYGFFMLFLPRLLNFRGTIEINTKMLVATMAIARCFSRPVGEDDVIFISFFLSRIFPPTCQSCQLAWHCKKESRCCLCFRCCHENRIKWVKQKNDCYHSSRATNHGSIWDGLARRRASKSTSLLCSVTWEPRLSPNWRHCRRTVGFHDFSSRFSREWSKEV